MRWLAVVTVMLLSACGLGEEPTARLREVATAAGCESVKVVDHDPGFTDTGMCSVRSTDVRVDVNDNAPMSGLVQRFNAGGFGNPCSDGSAVQGPWISVGEGWMVLSTTAGPAQAAADALDGKLLDPPSERGTPISFPIEEALIHCP